MHSKGRETDVDPVQKEDNDDYILVKVLIDYNLKIWNKNPGLDKNVLSITANSSQDPEGEEGEVGTVMAEHDLNERRLPLNPGKISVPVTKGYEEIVVIIVIVRHNDCFLQPTVVKLIQLTLEGFDD